MRDSQQIVEKIDFVKQVLALNMKCLVYATQMLEDVRQRSWEAENELKAETERRLELEQLADHGGKPLADLLNKGNYND